MKKIRFSGIIGVAILCLGLLNNKVQAQTRISSVVHVMQARNTKVIGYGLVTGLARTGDRTFGGRGSSFTVQSIANMLKKFGINVDPRYMRTRNVAAVMVTAKVSAYDVPGSDVDVTISSLGDARSLRGGVLLKTPLINPQTNKVMGYAQGALVLGGISVRQWGSSISRNRSLTATIPNGGSVIHNKVYIPSSDQPLGLILDEPNYTNAHRIVEAINQKFGNKIASAKNAGYVSVSWPNGSGSTGDMNSFTSTVMNLEIKEQTPARVVINERTGTIVAGGNVKIGHVLISHGTVEIRSQVRPFVSQPAPFSYGQTVTGAVSKVGLKEGAAKNMVLQKNTDVETLAKSLNKLGFSPRDIISIFEAIDKAGALKGKLIIM
jgi:flagellar P-ring protein precursor FlgI